MQPLSPFLLLSNSGSIQDAMLAQWDHQRNMCTLNKIVTTYIVNTHVHPFEVIAPFSYFIFYNVTTMPFLNYFTTQHYMI